MVISLNLLSKFVDLSGISLDELVHTLTFSGFEVEGVSTLAKASGLVIGEILEVKEHPDSDHLHVLKVDEGEKRGVKQIVCGAPNVKEHLHIIVATEGAVIGRDDVKIVPSVIRGVESNGMCCSLLELGVDKALLSEKQCSGIEELDDSVPVGEEKVLEYLHLDDTLIEINVLANRSDCLSIYSFAQEVAALFNRKVMIEKYDIPSNKKATYKVNSLTPSCKQFSLRVVNSIKVKPSPIWLQEALRSQGIRSINNIVDIGNYAMLLTGRPLHMYDLDKISTHEFVVRDDISGEFVALDDKTYPLENGDVVVTDSTNPLCLGGIMGAACCAVSESTKNIGVECATFFPARVRRTSSRIGLSSDSSSRFVKGIHPSNHLETLQLVSYLLKELADAKDFEEIITYDVREAENREIKCSYSYINHRLGTEISNDKMDEVFASLDIKINRLDDDNFIAIAPERRIDLKCNADLCEEIFRTIGLEQIKPTLPITPMTLGGLTSPQRLKRAIREHLISLGLNETLTYSLVSEKESEDCVLLTKNNTCYKLLNPMTVEHAYVRKSLLSSLLDVVTYNRAHQLYDMAIFETTSIETKEANFTSLAIVLTGNKKERGLLSQRSYNYYDIAGIFKSIMSMLSLTSSRVKIQPLNDPCFHPGRSAEILVNNKRIGVMGELHPSYLTKRDLDLTYALEINLSALLDLKTSPLKMEQISKYPFVTRDYAFVIKKEVSFKEIEMTIKKRSSSLIKEIDVFDVYEGEHVASGYKSIALRLTYVSMDHTLKENEINEAENKALEAMASLGAELRK